MVITYRNGWYTAEFPHPNLDPCAGTYKTDLQRRPRHLDKFLDHDKSGQGIGRYIYEVQGDTLRIAYRGDKGERPTSFADSNVLIMTFKRVKK